MLVEDRLLGWRRMAGSKTERVRLDGFDLSARLIGSLALALALVVAVWLAAPSSAAKDDTTLVSLAQVIPGGKVNASAIPIDVSSDGRYVAFGTQATNLDAEDTEGDEDIYVRDTVAGTTTLVTPGDGVDGSGSDPAISDDGETLAFVAYEDIGADDTNNEDDIYVADLTVDPPDLELVSRPTGAPGPGTPAPPEGATEPAISGDGNVVGFASADNTLDPVNDTDTMAGAFFSKDIFVRDLGSDTTELVSRGALDGNRASYAPSLDTDGSHVSFDTQSSNLDAADSDEERDVYVRNRTGATLTLVSRADTSSGAKANDTTVGSSLNGDGNVVSFLSEADNLDGDDSDSTYDVYIRDLGSEDTELISRASGAAGAKANKISQVASISTDGTEIAFISSASNLDPDYTTVANVNHAYIRDLDDDSTRLQSRADGANGAIADDGVQSVVIGANGRALGMVSKSTNLDPDDTDTISDAYVRDTGSGDTRLASQAPFGDPANANGISQDPSMSDDGRYVAFQSDATNLDPDASNNRADIFVYDAQAETVELASRADGGSGAEGDGNSSRPSISPDGRYVAFESDAENLDTDGDAEADIFVRDLQADTTELVSLDDSDQNIGGFPSSPSISEDGDRVAFDATDDYHPDGNEVLSNIYVRDLSSDETLLVSRENNNTSLSADDSSYLPDISADGNKVAFETEADNLDGDGGGFQQIVVRDIAANTNEIVSRADATAAVPGAVGSRDAREPSISGDGSRVVWHSDASNLHPDDPTTNGSIFVRDRDDDETILASRNSSDTPADGSAEGPAISADGTYVAFVSAANNLDPASDDTRPDVYHRDLILGLTKMASRAQGPGGAQGDDSDADPDISEHGRYTSFDSRSTNLDSADDDGSSDVYRRDVLGPDTTPPNTSITSGPANGSFNSQTAFTFGFTVDDLAAELECRLDGGGYTPCSGSFATGALGQGAHAFEVRGTDRVGNVESPATSRAFTVDTIAPNTLIDAGPRGAGADSTPSASFRSTETGASLQCSLDGAAFSGCSSPLALGPLADGDHSFRVRSIDRAGNLDGSPAERSFSVDTEIDGRKLKAAKSQKVKKKKVKVKATVKTGEPVEVKLTGKVTKGGGKLKTINTDAADGEKLKLVAKLKSKKKQKKVVKKVKQGKKPKAKLTLTVTDEVGNTETTKKTVKLK